MAFMDILAPRISGTARWSKHLCDVTPNEMPAPLDPAPASEATRPFRPVAEGPGRRSQDLPQSLAPPATVIARRQCAVALPSFANRMLSGAGSAGLGEWV